MPKLDWGGAGRGAARSRSALSASGLALGIALLAGCGASGVEDEPASLSRLRAELSEDTQARPDRTLGEESGSMSQPSGASASVDALPRGQIRRAELQEVLAEGPGRFLQGVVTEPHREDGEFVGFRIVSFFPGDPRFEGVDLRSGDVVARVNGTFIERPEQLIGVWESLATAESLEVDGFREGAPHQLRFRIVD